MVSGCRPGRKELAMGEGNEGTSFSASWEEHRLNRRQLLGRAATAGAAFVVAGAAAGAAGAARTAPTAGGTPATRAIAGLKALNLPKGTKITVFAEDLTILGPEVTQK